MTIEEVKTIYFDQYALRLQPYKVGRVSIGAGRAYFKYELPVKLYTSLTTIQKVCSPMPYGLFQWWLKHGEKEASRLMNVAAKYGTLMHIEIGKFCVSQEYDFDKTTGVVDDYLSTIQFYDPDTTGWAERLKEDMQAWATFVFEYKVKVLAVEMVLCSDAYEFGTAIDIVCVMDVDESIPTPSGTLTASGKKSTAKFTTISSPQMAIINLKSGRHGFYAENANQLELERMVWNENYPDMQIEKVFNWSPTEWRNISGDKYNLKDQSGKANKIEMEAMLMLASERYKGKHERASYINIHGSIYYGADPSKNIYQTAMISELEKKIAEYKLQH